MKTIRGRSSTWHSNKNYHQNEENDNKILGRKTGIRVDCFLDPGANVGVVSSRFRLIYTRRNTSTVPQSRMLGGPQGQSERADGNDPLWVSLIWSKSDYRKPVVIYTIFISIRNGKRRLWKCHLFPPCLPTPSRTDRKWCFSYFCFTCNGHTSFQVSRSPFLIDPPSIATIVQLLRKLSHAAILTSVLLFFDIFFSTSRKMLRHNHKLDLEIKLQ